ncbi:hypothetical protein [Chryseobacterium hispalense]|uniref:hypothetical protein n=1 Tax=Chryseobacterium hispalense TaxID=1453492 RepID=UPI0039197E88
METIYQTLTATPEVLVTYNPRSKETLNYERVTHDHNGTLIDDNLITANANNIYIKNNGYYYRAVFHDNVINLNNFIDRSNVNGLDITDLLKYVIKLAYNLSAIQQDFREPLKIKIPSGRFKIKDSIINSSSNVVGGKFVFEGEGNQNTCILYEPTNPGNFLFENIDIFGFTTFNNISFISNEEGKFMKAQVETSGNAQSIVFSDCRFEKFKTILDVSGNIMMSEVTFRNCKIFGGESEAVLFKLNNPQAVNWRFYSTEIESIIGTVFDFYAGSTISYFQGSIIGNDNPNTVIFKVNSAANPNLFGSGNSPNLHMYGVRFELRGDTKLIKIENSDVEFSAKFDNCGMGGFNLSPSTYTVDIKGRGNFIFDNCTNYENFKFKHEINNANNYLNPTKVKFINTCPDLDIINNGLCNDVVNTGGYPIYIFENCGLNSYYRPFGRDTFFLNNESYKISKKIISKGYRNDGNEITGMVQDRIYADLGQNNNEYKHLVTFNLPNVPIHSIKIIFDKAWESGFGGLSYNVKVYNTDMSDEIATGILNTFNKLELTDKRGYFVANNDKLHIEVQSIGGWSQILGVKTFLVVEY